MDLREKSSFLKRYTEILLRFRLPLALTFLLILIFGAGDLAGGSILVAQKFALFSCTGFLDYIRTAHLGALLLFLFPLLYLVLRMIFISVSSTLVQLALVAGLIFLMQSASLINPEYMKIGWYSLYAIFLLVSFATPKRWLVSLFPIFTGILLWNGFFEILTKTQLFQPYTNKYLAAWLIFSALVLGDLLQQASAIGSEVNKGRAKLGAITAVFEKLWNGYFKITAALLVLAIVSFVPFFGVSTEYIKIGAISYVLYIMFQLFVFPIIFSFAPYKNR
jgi:hypothetical protein